ncbi:MAG TPA: pyrimidine 5'-nucleotidase [Anaerolineales bacterium]|nr:pyrimidine 5'-nucleotidase [Anaerolineales bacterium]
MRFTTIFFDLDDTLYPSGAGLWKAIKGRMNDYMREHLDIDEKEIPQLREKYFLQYGTTLRGLQAHHKIDSDEYLAYVHDLPLKDYLVPNPIQRSIIASLPTCNLIFTNADIHHARRVLTVLDLNNLFTAIVDVNAVAPYCKPMPESFGIAMKIAGETDPSRCAMIDDLRHTTRAAREAGMFSILYNNSWSVDDADTHFTDWNELVNILDAQ